MKINKLIFHKNSYFNFKVCTICLWSYRINRGDSFKLTTITINYKSSEFAFRLETNSKSRKYQKEWNACPVAVNIRMLSARYDLFDLKMVLLVESHQGGWFVKTALEYIELKGFGAHNKKQR